MPTRLAEHNCVVVGRSHLVFDVAAFGAGGSFLTHTYNVVPVLTAIVLVCATICSAPPHRPTNNHKGVACPQDRGATELAKIDGNIRYPTVA